MKTLMVVDTDVLHMAFRDASLNADEVSLIFAALSPVQVDLTGNQNRRARNRFHGSNQSNLGKGYKPPRSAHSPSVRKRVSG